MGAVPAAAIENPVTGEQIRLREHTESILRFDYTLAPGGFSVGRLEHAHPRQVEQVRVRSGRFRVRVDGEEWTATTGDRFTVPADVPHALRNDAREPARATVELRPALDSAAFFRTTFGLAHEGRTNEWGVPAPLQFAVLLDAFDEEFYLVALPRAVQRAVAALLAPIGRLRGYRARYDRYEPDAVEQPAGGRPDS